MNLPTTTHEVNSRVAESIILWFADVDLVKLLASTETKIGHSALLSIVGLRVI